MTINDESQWGDAGDGSQRGPSFEDRFSPTSPTQPPAGLGQGWDQAQSDTDDAHPLAEPWAAAEPAAAAQQPPHRTGEAGSQYWPDGGQQYQEQNPYGYQSFPTQDPYGGQRYVEQNPYGGQQRYQEQNSYGGQEQYQEQNPYGGQQQYQEQNPYAGQPFPTQGPYGGQQQYQEQSPYGESYPGQSPFEAQWAGQQPYGYGGYGYSPPAKSKTTAALLAFFLGWIGVHNFYLGKKNLGLIHVGIVVGAILVIIASVIGASNSGDPDSPLLGVAGLAFFAIIGNGIWAFVEFIMILVKPHHRLGR